MSPDGVGIVEIYKEVACMPKTVVYEFGKKEKTRWGMWEVVTHPKKDPNGDIIECQKHITVNPDASLSLQVHKGRGETYRGLEGVTHVCVNGEIYVLKAGDELYIPRGALHFSWNESDKPSKFHEIQAGPLCDEADIKRSADKYKLAHELDDDDDVVRMMIDVCADRYKHKDFAIDDYSFPTENMSKTADNDLLNIYLEHKNDGDALRAEMLKVLQKCIHLHNDRTPTPMPVLNEPVATCEKKV